tara:strand:+ start:67 stop:918 length:852 start_codon:yes stop_codon:yes gene_type:complete
LIDPEKFYMAGVMGWPVMHSRSPMMHNYWMKQQGIKGTYVFLGIKPEGLESALRALHPLGFSGCNLTIPHKLDAMTMVDEVDDTARKIGAISCVIVGEDGTLSGTNNDWLGFLGNLKHQQPGWRADSGPCTVIGAGGGGRAVVYGLLEEGAKEVRLVNRTQHNAERIAEDFNGPISVYPWKERNSLLEGATTVVNVTNQGMVGEAPLDITLEKLAPDALAADIIYTPLESPFLAAAAKRQNKTVNGLGMLLHQGPPAWKRWFKIEPTVTDELRGMMEQSILLE